MNNLVECVAKGIKVLDARGPEDWRDRITLSTLDLRTYTNCVIGQIYGNNDPSRRFQVFDSAVLLLIGTRSDAATAAHGFTLEKASHAHDAQWEELTNAWRSALSP